MLPISRKASVVRVLAAIGIVSWSLLLQGVMWPGHAEEPESADISPLVGLLELVIDADADTARQCLTTLGDKIRAGEVDRAKLADLKSRLGEIVGKILKDPAHPLLVDTAHLAALWGDAAALESVRKLARDDGRSREERQRSLATLVFARDEGLVKLAGELLRREEAEQLPVKQAVFATLARAEEPEVAGVVLASYEALEPEIKPQAIELLTQRVAWSKALVAEIAAERIPRSAVNVNQVRKLVALGDAELTRAVTQHWGQVREGRDPAREEVIGRMRELLSTTPGDPHRGVAVFSKLCGQCHKLHGEGQDVGPDITLNGRSSYDQLLSNVFDPSLVIGASYQARTVRTVEGRVVTGLLAEESDERIVLKVEGGKLESIPADEVEAMKVSELSLMPEGVEKQLQPQEIADLFALITLDKHPSDREARRIPGAQLAPAVGTAAAPSPEPAGR